MIIIHIGELDRNMRMHLTLNMTLRMLLVILTSVACYGDAKFKVNKCCGENEHLHETSCIKTSSSVSESNNTGWPWWFPTEAGIMNSATQLHLRRFPSNAEIYYQMELCSHFKLVFLFQSVHDYQFLEDGSLHVFEHESQSSDVTYPPLSFCVDRFTFSLADDDYVIKLCPCQTATCTLKCCPNEMELMSAAPNKKLVVTDEHCTKVENASWIAPVEENVHVLHTFPSCEEGEFLSATQLKAYYNTKILDNGSLSVYNESQLLMNFEKEKYCTEHVQFKNEMTVQYIFSCSKKNSNSFKNILYGFLSTVGAMFLLSTIIVYCMLTREWTVNDKNLIAQVWSLLFGYIGVAIAQFALHLLNRYVCVVLGYIILYSFLASFFWLNILCIDLAWTFSEVRMIRNMSASKRRMRYIQYSVYGWISPAIIVITAVAVDLAPNVPSGIIKPEISKNCWFKNDSLGKLAYFYGPVAVLLVANVVLFVYTVYRIQDAQKQTSRLLHDRTAQEKRRTLLYVKLFCLMGISWCFELLSWAIGGPEYYWYLTDIVNLLRAIFIFITLCWKKEVLEEMRERLNLRKRKGRQTASPSIVTANSTLSFPTTSQITPSETRTTLF